MVAELEADCPVNWETKVIPLVGVFLCIEWYWVTIFILLEIHTYTDILHMLVIVIQSLSCVRLFMIPRTVAHQAPLSVGIPKQED